MDGIKFGTSGWRAVIAEGFTVDNLRILASAIAERMAAEGGRACVVAHDARFGGERFAAEVCRAVAGRGVKPLLCRGVTPTPVAARFVIESGAAGGMVVTASHNDPEYSGLKWITGTGASPGESVTGALEQRVADLDPAAVPLGAFSPEPVDPAPAYFQALGRQIDRAAFRRARLPVFYDALHGAGSGYLDRYLTRLGCRVETIHREHDPRFGGHAPDPSADHLKELAAKLRRRGLRLGLATDGDADRYGVVDPRSGFLEPNDVLSLLLDYLARSRGLKGDVVCSVATSRMLHRVAAVHGLRVRVCRIGFKHMAPFLIAGQAALAGEESAGFALADHLPDKDGMLACVLFAEMVAAEGRSPHALLARLHRRFGPLFSGRTAVPADAGTISRLRKMSADPPVRLGGRAVREAGEHDGLHLVLGRDSWVHLRASGTEPVVRIYGEAASVKARNRLIGAARNLLLSPRGA